MNTQTKLAELRRDASVQTKLAELRRDASVRAGLDDFGDPWYEGPLQAWIEDLESPTLNDFGREFLRRLAVGDLVRRLRVLDALSRNPEIEDVPIPAIVYVTGHERTGTTLLHNLLSLHADARALLRWELMAPVPPPKANTYRSDPRIAKVQASIDGFRIGLLEHMHWVNADEPDECVWGFIDAVGMLGQAISTCMPNWRTWLRAHDPTPAYRNYRRLIKLLLWKNPVVDGGFLVLKAPQIAQHIEAFAEVFPEATFVAAHRDPYRAITSTATLVRSIIDPFCGELNALADDGRRNQMILERSLRSYSQIMSLDDTQPHRIVHVRYADLMDNAVATTEKTLATTAPLHDPALESKVLDYLERQRQGGRPTPPAELDTAGYDIETVLTHPVIADYCRRYDIPVEHTRHTDTQSGR